MKKIILTSLVIFATAAVSFAQSPTGTDDATLTVNLDDVKTIEVLNKDVLINVHSSADYINVAGASGKTESIAKHLKVTSTGAFQVTVEAQDLKNGSDEIKAANIYLNVISYDTPTTTDALGGYSTVADRSLSTSAQQLISTTGTNAGTPESTFDVSYTLKNAPYVANLPQGDYETTVTYTILPN